MKKSTKIILIAAVVLLLVGGIMALVCLAMGASLDDATIEFKNVLKWEQLEVLDPSDMMDMMGDGENVDTWTFEGEEIHSLELDIEAGTLYIQSGDSYMVAVENGRDGMRCDVKNGVLTLKETDSIHTLLDWSGDSTPTVMVVLPEDVTVETIHVTVGAGNVQAQSLWTKSLDIYVDAGSFTCSEVQVNGRCEIDVDAGNVNIRGGQIQGDLQIDVDAGMVTYRGSLSGDWQVDCDAGNVEMGLAASMEDYNFQIEYDLGTVKIGSREFSGMSDQAYLSNGARYQAQIQCDVGQVDVNFTH